MLGVASLICKYKDKQIDLFVAEAEGQPPLLGLTACQELRLMKFVRTVDTADITTESPILDEFNDLFEGIGELEGDPFTQAKARAIENAAARCHRKS